MTRYAVPKFAPLWVALAVLVTHFPAAARATCKPPAGRFASIEGHIQIRSGEEDAWRQAKSVEALCQGDTIRVGERSRAALVLANEAVMRLDQNTTIRLIDISGNKQERSLIDLVRGAVKTFIRKPRLLSVNTPYLNGSIEGTEFQVSVAEGRASILVLEGRVLASNAQGSVAVAPGEVAEARAGGAPTARLLVKPRDAVQWALYYPPLLSDQAGQADPVTAFAALDKVPEDARNADFHLRRAAALLNVGRQDEAAVEIDAALKRDPQAGLAHALRAVIHVVRNEREQALAEANKAVLLGDTAAARIAQSYALQASFRLDEARDSLLAAVRQHSEDPLAWARLGEMQLMLGETRQAGESAARAAALAPGLARTNLVLGYTELVQYRDQQALASFRRAIESSPSDPLAHLGLGLALVSGGQLAAGREEMEIAVALDAGQALPRTYLGKAYFEERRAPLDAEQFSLAKNLDPLDPTAFLYDAIRRQTENRPVEALADLEQSMVLNDNRAVYRGRLLLDKDQAARGASLARVYNDLGFAALGVDEATRSLASDPANASAHRFLADVYQSVRRREIARVSELFQAQMLQDLNLNPIQPSTGEANLNIVTAGGPASAGFNEFTPLFQRNRTQFSVAALGGNHDTHGAETALSGLYGRTAFSVGAMTYDTDGWRPNNGLDQDLYNLYGQVALTDQVHVQAELRHRKSTEGDLAFNFEPDDFQMNKTTRREQDTARIGLRYSPTPHSHVLLSYIHTDRDEDLREVQDLPPVLGVTTFTNNQAVNEEADQVEAQFLYVTEALNLILGAAWSESDRVDDVSVSVDDSILGNLLTVTGQDKLPFRNPRAYAYANLRAGAGLTWTLGASHDDFEQAAFEENSFNPKLGVQWDVSPDLRLRAAAFQVVKPALVGNRSLEPTQVAGFNQLFDDINGTRSRRYGLGLDWRVAGDMKAGAELTYRTLDEPLIDPNTGGWITEEREEQWHRLYWLWTPGARWSVQAELVYDRYHSQSGIATDFNDLPEQVDTWSLPLSVGYFHPSGWFAGLGASYVDQTVRRSALATQASGDDQFVVVDASIGYRLPRRYGLLSLAVRNLFDTEFRYQDDSYREFRDEPSIGPYFPERTLMARFTLSF